jgi:hypothetical protein
MARAANLLRARSICVELPVGRRGRSHGPQRRTTALHLVNPAARLPSDSWISGSLSSAPPNAAVLSTAPCVAVRHEGSRTSQIPATGRGRRTTWVAVTT